MSRIKREIEAGHGKGTNPVYYDDLVDQIQKSINIKLKVAIAQKGLVNTHKLLNTLLVDVRHDYGEIPNIHISFNAYGRVAEVQTAIWSRLIPVKKLATWVKKKGIENFDFVPGYKAAPTKKIAAERIAWGIASYRQTAAGKNQYGEFARKHQWGRENISISTSHLAHLITERLEETAQQAVVSGLQVSTFTK